MTQKILLLCLVVLGLLPSVALAQIVESRGTATVVYGSSLTPVVRNEAIERARFDAVERYIAGLGEAAMQNFDRNFLEIQSRLEAFTSDPVVLSEDDDLNTLRYSVSVRVEINVARLTNFTNSTSAVATGDPAERSRVVFVFVGREVAAVTTFDDTVVRQVSSETSTDAAVSVDERAAGQVNTTTEERGSEGEDIRSDAISTTSVLNQAVDANTETSIAVDASASVETTVREESSGSTTRRAGETERRIFATNDLDVAIRGAFSQAGFETVDAAFVLSEETLSALLEEFASTNKPSPSSLRASAAELQNNGIRYFAFATLDVGNQDVDPATGLPRINVSVTAEIYDLTEWPPSTLAAVGPVQITGVGLDPEAARREALSRAATEGTRELVSRVNVAGLR